MNAYYILVFSSCRI